MRKAELTAVRLKILLLRGIGAGAVGSIIWISELIYQMRDQFRETWGQWLFVGCLFYAPLGALIGGIVTLIVWLIHDKWTTELGWLSRFGIGLLVATIWRFVMLLSDGLSSFTQGPLRNLTADILYFGLLMGGIAGLAVGRQKRKLHRNHERSLRIAAALWFGAIIGLAILSKLIGTPVGTFSIYAWLTLLVPTLVGAFAGAFLGRAILGRSDPVPWLLAIARGFGIAAMSAVSYVITLALVGSLTEPDKSINRFLSLIFFMSVYLGVPIFLITLIVGSLSGVILYAIAPATSDLVRRVTNH